jgi:O-succinylbenzoic acid--CoA ligase
VLLSREAMRSSASATYARLGGPGQWLLALPPSYVAGVQVLFRSVLSGTEPVLLDEQEDLSVAVRAMAGPRRYTSLVPTQLTSMLASERDVAALRTFDAILVGGAALEPRLRQDAERAGLGLVATYGMSETCGGCVYDGVALDGVAVAVSTGGRVRVGGPVLFDGYDGQPELTAQVLQDGWFLTSDLGRLDDGLLQVLGRADDVVISGGVNVPTDAVAARVREHEDVRAVEVVGITDSRWGQRVVAVVTTARAVDLAEIRDFVSDRLPRAWTPRELVVVDELPLLRNGKVDRKAVEQMAVANQARLDAERGAAQRRTGRGSAEDDDR